VGGLVTAFRTLTLLPVPGREAGRVTDALPYFPVVGAVIGLLVSGAGWGVLALVPGWYAGTAAVMVMAEMVLTGAIHTDGLGDTADSLGAGRDRERALAIMKDSRQGTYGVVAVGLSLLLKWSLYSFLLTVAGGWLLVTAAFAVSRQATAHLAAFQPYARPEGGIGAAFTGGGSRLGIACGWLIAAAVCLAAGLATLAVLIPALILAAAFARWCRARYGGITGDLLGAHTELSHILTQGGTVLLASAQVGTVLLAWLFMAAL